MARLEDKNTNLAVTTVFIDDPVCSFDCNHLFHSYALIKNKLAEAQQLIISTHNFEFFNLIRDWFKPAKSEASFYLIEKGHNGQLEAKLSEMPSLLLKFKSEYHFLFSILHRFSQNPTSDYNYLYILPNLVRRYLEAFLGFKTPICAGLKKKLPRLITDSVEHEKVLKFIDEYSHNKSLPRSLNFPDFSECRDVVAIVLRAVEAKDKEHYDALVDEINSE